MMFIVTIFCFFVFSTLALGLIFLSQIHLKLNGLRKNSILLDYASENGIKTGFHDLMKALSHATGPRVISKEDYERLRESTANAQLRLIEETVERSFPVVILETGEGLMWKSQTNCFLDSFTEAENFFLAQFRLDIDSEGWLKSLPPRRNSRLESRTAILAGHVPLSFFPLLIDKNLTTEERQNFEKDNEIQITLPPQNLSPVQASFADELLIPQEANGLIEKALNIKIFRPQDLSTSKLRLVLGLEESDAPIPDGVYLLQNDLGLGGIYIQGDVKEMVTAIEEDFQVIFFRMEKDSWILKFSPSRSETLFYSPSGLLSFSLIPLGIIIVNGNVESLGGGTVDDTGDVSLVRDAEIPSLLPGINLTLVASEKITITSHLIRRGVTWQEGIPYLKEKDAQLVIFSTGKDPCQGEARDGGIVIGADAPAAIQIHASLEAQGDGFRIEGKNRDIRLVGSLQTTEYVAQGNRLQIFPQNPSDFMNATVLMPETKKPVLFLSFLEILAWKE
jgi:hypothetical protein